MLPATPVAQPLATPRASVTEATATPTPAKASPPSRQLRGRAAHFVGGARRSHSQRKSRASPLRAARRSVGAKLKAPPCFEVVPASYDASKLRMRIQFGLRVSSCLRSERGRESKTPSASKGSDMSTGVRIQANEFRQRFKRKAENDRSNPLLKSWMTPRLRVGRPLPANRAAGSC